MQKNSTYLKIQHSIQLASINNITIESLAKTIHNEDLGPFFYYRQDEDGNTQTFPCNIGTIQDKIRFCFDLGLLENEENCSLTSMGERAIDNNHYEIVLQQLILEFLEENGISMDVLENAINREEFPGPSELYNSIMPGLSEDTFRTCLYLLSQCGQSTDDNILSGIILKVYQIN